VPCSILLFKATIAAKLSLVILSQMKNGIYLRSDSKCDVTHTRTLYLSLRACVQGVLPIFKELAEISKFMEGEKSVLSSLLWNALFSMEEVMKPHAGDTPAVAVFRSLFNSRLQMSFTC
jgi:hypothetical protein